MKHVTVRPDGSRRVYTVNDEPSKTDQQFKGECDVNNIMANARKGVMPRNIRERPGVYADVSEIPDLLECMEIMSKAQQDFDNLPAQIRKRFGNSPVELVDFLNDSKNDEEAIKLGFKQRNKDSLALEQAKKLQEQNVQETKEKLKDKVQKKSFKQDQE